MRSVLGSVSGSGNGGWFCGAAAEGWLCEAAVEEGGAEDLCCCMEVE